MILAVAVAAALQIATSKPPVQLLQLDFLIGKWTTSIEGKSVRLDVVHGPGKRSLRFELVVSSRNTQSFIDDGYLWWDKEPAAFRSLAMTSVSNDPRREIGRLTDGALIMVSEPFEVNGVSERSRRTLKPTSGALSFTLDLRENDAWKTRITAVLKKSQE
jgi:hypothetical protein